MHFDNYHLNLLPLPAIDASKTAGKVAHDRLAKLAEAMLQLHRSKGKLEQGFAEALDNHPHEWKELGDTYWSRADYVSFIEKKAHVKPNDTGAITGLRCELDGKTVQISAKVADDWKPILDMTIADDKLRFFIFYGIRQFLHDNARKKKWGDGKLLALVLENIEVPVFLSHGVHDAENHLATVKLVLTEMQKHSPLHNLTELERDIAATDDEIDRLVYKLYGLTEEEIRIVESANK
jgi:hypothetical protein